MDRVKNDEVLARVGEKNEMLDILKRGKESVWDTGGRGTTLWLKYWKSW